MNELEHTVKTANASRRTESDVRKAHLNLYRRTIDYYHTILDFYN